MRFRTTCLFAIAAVVVGAPRTSADPPPIRIGHQKFHEWKDAWRIANNTVEVIYVPQVGRIMRYALIGARNMLWLNSKLAGKDADLTNPDWQNFGGDKLWTAPQSAWGWPPDPMMDRGPSTVTTSGNHLVITGSPCPRSGIQFRREIVLEPTGPKVTIINTMTNISDKPVQWSVWEVAQTGDPDQVSLPLDPGGKFANGYTVLGDTSADPAMLSTAGDRLTVKRNTTKSFKCGTSAKTGPLIASEESLDFIVSADFSGTGDFPDGGCAEEIYTNPDPLKYVELELLGPVVTLQPHESVSMTTHWTLRRTR
jgi:hypothetical protein